MSRRRKELPLAVLASPKREKRRMRLVSRSTLIFALGMAAAIAAGTLKLDAQPVAQRVHVDHRGRVLIIRDPQQVDLSVQWIALDPNDGGYAAAQAALAATASNVPASYGAYAVVDGANGYTGLKICGPFYMSNADLASAGLATIDFALVYDRFNYKWSRNQFYSAPTYATDPWSGDQYIKYGIFLAAPIRMPTTGEDLRLAIATGASAKTAIYVSRLGSGDGSGSSYANCAGLEDSLGNANTVTTANADCLVICGDLISQTTWGVGGNGAYLYTKAGTATDRLQILSHPVDAARFIGVQYVESTSTIGTWTSIGSGTWQLNLGTGVAAPASDFQFCFKYEAGVLTPLTMVASSAACQALTDSFFPEADYSGSSDRVTVHLADGSNPGTKFVVSCAIFPYLVDQHYFDVFGCDFIGNVWLGSGAGTMDEFAFYSCGFGYTALAVFRAGAGEFDEGTGAFTWESAGNYKANANNRKWVGCRHRYGYVLIYDINNGHSKVPTNTLVRDSYFHDTNGVPADSYGFQCFSASDAHCIATQGADGHSIINNVCENTGNQTLLHYLQPNNFGAPTGGLENADYYTIGVNYPTECFTNDGGATYTYGGVLRNIYIAYNFILNPRCTGAYAAGSGQVIALNGDTGQCLGLNGNYRNILIECNRVHGPGVDDGAIRAMLAYPDGDENIPIIRRNILRVDHGTAFRAGNNVPTAGGTIVFEPSFALYDNDIQSLDKYVLVPNVANPAHHIQIFDRQTYRGGGEWWLASGSTFGNLTDWRAAQLSGDVYDPNSVEI